MKLRGAMDGLATIRARWRSERHAGSRSAARGVAVILYLAFAGPPAAAQDIIAECWEYEDEINGMRTLFEAGEYTLALSATEGLPLADMNVDCHSYVREFRARIHQRRGNEERAIEEYLTIFDRDPQWRPVDVTLAEDAFVAAVRSQWLQENPIGLRVAPRSIDLADAPPEGVELELSHDDRFVLKWRVKNKPEWVDLTKYGGTTEDGTARTRVILRELGVLGRPGVIDLECKPWAEVQVPVFGFERDFATEEAAPTLTTGGPRRSGPPLWLRVVGGALVVGGAGYVAAAILGSDDGPSTTTPPFQLPEPPDPPTERAHLTLHWRF